MPEPVCSREERLKQLLKILDTFCSDSSTATEMQQLANEAKRVVNKMQNFLERSLVEQVAELVQAKKWDEVNEKIEQNFPGGLNIGKVEEILELVYLNGSVEHLVSAITWVVNLDVKLQPRACEALYEQLKCKKLADQPQVLLLLKVFVELPKGQVSENLRAQLAEDFRTSVDQIVRTVKKGDFSQSNKMNKMMKMIADSDVIFNEVVTAVVSKFETFTLENTLHLIQFSEELPLFENSCVFMDALMKMLEARNLLCSEQGLQLWAHAKYTMEEEPGWMNVPKETQKLCTDVVEKLTKHKLTFFQHYQKYVEDQDKLKSLKLHKRNQNLCSIVSEFVTWYYKQEDLTTVQNLLSAARATECFIAMERILTQLQIEMQKFQQMNTFEAFRLFNEVKKIMKRTDYDSLEPEAKASFEELKSKAPTCLRLLLWPDKEENQLQLVNKFYDSPLSFKQDQFICSNTSLDKELLCSASVNRKTSLTTFSFKSGTESCKLDVTALEDNKTKKPWIGTPWKLKAVDDTHVKIFTDDGE
jgi:hypothetical protein